MAWDMKNILVNQASAIKKAGGGGGSDIDTRVTALETTVGDSSSGLVKDVDDLETTVGDSEGGLVKEVSDLTNAVGALLPFTLSTTETKIGSYAGADLYAKIVTGVALANNTNVTVSCPGIIPRLLFAMEHGVYTSDEDYTPIPYLGTNKLNIYYDAKNGNIVIEITGNYTSATADIIVFYTKPVVAENSTRKKGGK